MDAVRNNNFIFIIELFFFDSLGRNAIGYYDFKYFLIKSEPKTSHQSRLANKHECKVGSDSSSLKYLKFHLNSQQKVDETFCLIK